MPPNGGILDIGANIGLASVFFHHEAAGIPIVAIEPAPGPFRALEDNVRRFSINAVTLRTSLGHTAGVRRFTYFPRNTMSSTLYAEALDNTELDVYLRAEGVVDHAGRVCTPNMDELKTFQTPVATLSDVLAATAMETVGLLKIDAEHAEVDILRGLRSDDWPRVSQAVVEVHGGQTAVRAVCELFSGRGMNVIVEQEPSQVGTRVYMLYATRKHR